MMQVTVEFALKPGMEAEFDKAVALMRECVKACHGFPGEQACRRLDDDGRFITLFRWRDREAIKAWYDDPVHKRVQQLGRDRIFAWYRICVAEIARHVRSLRTCPSGSNPERCWF